MDMMAVVNYLAHIVGPREPTTKAERSAGEWIGEQMKEIGLDVSVQTFRAARSFSFTYKIIYGLSVLAALVIYPVHPGFGVIVGGVAAWLFWRETDTFHSVTKLLSFGQSRNVIGKVKCDQAVQRIVVCAHYDASRSALLFHPKMVSGFRSSFILSTIAIAGVPLFGFFGAKWVTFYWLAIACGVYLMFPLLVLLHRELKGRAVPGANDNGSGVAVLLGAAAELADDNWSRSEVWFVATGAEEAGTLGMTRLLTDLDRSDTIVINLDNLGTGDVKYTVAEGPLTLFKADPDLVELTNRVSISEGLDVGPWNYRTLTTDGTAAMARGFRATSIMGFSSGGIIPNWHWHTDVAANVQAENLESAKKLVVNLVRELDG